MAEEVPYSEEYHQGYEDGLRDGFNVAKNLLSSLSLNVEAHLKREERRLREVADCQLEAGAERVREWFEAHRGGENGARQESADATTPLSR